MALVTIVIQDNEEGNTDVLAYAEPVFPFKDGEPDDERLQGAHRVAMNMLGGAMDTYEVADGPHFEGEAHEESDEDKED